MSDLTASELLDRQIESLRAPTLGSFGPGRARVEETNFLEDVLFYVGKPEEWLVQMLGRTFTDDPRYHIGSTNLYDQVSFFDIAQNLTGQTSTAGNLLLNLPIGLAAAILNPLDPLNIAAIAKGTKAGIRAKLFTKAVKSGSIKTVRGAKQIDRAAQLSQLKKSLGMSTTQDLGKGAKQARGQALARGETVLRGQAARGQKATRGTISSIVPSEGSIGQLQTALKAGGSSAKTAKQKIQALKDFNKQSSSIEKLNQWLEFMQKEKGIPFEDLLEKKTFFERVRAGQQTILGLDPFDNPIIRKFGGISRKDRIARGAIKIKGLDPALQAGLYPIMRAGAKGKELATAALNKFLPAGVKLANTEVTKILTNVIQTMRKSIEAGKAFNAQEALTQHNFLARGVTKQDLSQIIDELENVFGGVETRALRDIIDKNPEEIFGNIRQLDRNAESIGISGKDLTNKQKELLGNKNLPRGFQNDQEVIEAFEKSNRAFAAGSKSGEDTILEGDRLYLDNDIIAIKFPDARDVTRKGMKAKVRELAQLDIPGLLPFSIVENAEGSFLLSKNTGVSTGHRWSQVHVRNLEKISALLAQKGYFFKDMDPKKILIGASGEVQIIDPNIIGRVRSNAAGGRVVSAANRSRETMRNKLFESARISSDYDFSILGHQTANRDIVLGVRKEELHFEDLTPNAKRLEGSDTVKYFNTTDLLQAHNAGYAKVLDDETVQKFGIDILAREIDEAGVMSPIKIRVDDAGQVFVSDGIDRLAAARFLGLEAVPVIREDFVGDIAKSVASRGGDASLRGPTRAVAQVMGEKPASYDTLGQDLQELLPSDVRILDPNTQKGIEEGIAITESVFSELDDSGVIYKMAEWFSRRGSRDPNAQRLGNEFFAQAERAFLDLVGADGTKQGARKAFLQLEELMESARDPHDFIAKLSSDLRLPHGTVNTAQRGPLADDLASMKAELGFMQAEFRRLTKDLNEKGLFTRGGGAAAVGDYTANTGRTVLRVIDDGLEFNNITRTSEQLAEDARQYIRQQAPDLAGNTKVELLGVSPTTTRVSGLLGETPAGSLGPLLPVETIFFTTKKTREALRQKNIFINPSREVLQKAGLRTVQGRLAARPEGVFAISLSGDMIFAPTHKSVDKLMTDLFGQAPRSMQEFGVFTKDGIQVSNILGLRSLSRLTRKELKPIEQRMKDIARSLLKAGFDPDMVLDFNTPYGKDLWDQMFRKNMKISGVANKGFKLDLPENIKGIDLTLYDERAGIAIHNRSKNLPEGRVRDIFRWVEDNLDDVALRELQAGLPLNVTAGYYPRFLSPELLVKLDELGTIFFSKGEKTELFDYYIKNFKHRTLSDLTTREIQQLFKDLQIDSTDLIAFDKLHGSKFMRALAEQDPKAAQFFLEDPILATTLRKDLSVQALSNKAAYEAITDKKNAGFVVWKGHADEFFRRQGIEEDTVKLWNEAEVAKGKISVLREDLQAAILDQSDEKIIKSLEDQIAKLGGQRDAAIEKALDNARFQVEKGFPLQGEIDQFGIVAIDKNVARQMVTSGVLDEATDFVGPSGVNWAAPYMKIETKTLLKKGIEGVEMTVLTREAGDFLDNYFGLMTNKDGIWDHFLKNYFDKANDLFKQTTLFLFPAVIPYTVRNFFSNVILGWLGNVEIQSYEMALRGLKKISNSNRGTMSLKDAEILLRNEIFTNDLGEVSNLHEIWGAFVHGGGLTGGLHVNEFGMSDKVLRASVKNGATPASNLVSGSFIANNKLLEGGRNFSAMIENHARFAAFMDSWRKGGSFEDAALNVKKIFYNYDELNQFERQTLKRVIPFYSWMRFNTPRMLETMATNPVKHYRIKSAIADIERGAGGPANPDELPSWLSDRWGIVIGRENDKLVISDGSFLLPMGDVRRLLASPVQFLADGTTPFLKYPVEQLFNKSLFSSRISDLFLGKSRNIERVPGEPARSGFLRSLGFSRRSAFPGVASPGPLGPMNLLLNESLVSNVRAVKWITDWVDWAWDNTNLREEVPTFQARLIDAFFSRAYTIDPARYQSIMQLQADKWVNRFKWAQKDALRRGDLDLVEFYRSRITDMETQK